MKSNYSWVFEVTIGCNVGSTGEASAGISLSQKDVFSLFIDSELFSDDRGNILPFVEVIPLLEDLVSLFQFSHRKVVLF